MATLQGPPKRPRLSLQIKTAIGPAVKSKGYLVDPKDPTTFNTLSNVYVTAIERSTPVTAINTLQSFSLNSPIEHKDHKQRVATPYVASYPETPLTAHATSPRQMEISFPSTMTATPPLSAGPIESNTTQVFTFSGPDTAAKAGMRAYALSSPVEARSPCRRIAPVQTSGLGIQPPYTHPRSLHSILRNSPLPPRTAIAPASPRRQSLRLQERAAKRVGYNNPLTQDIVTNKYVRSHIDLLTEEASPCSPSELAPIDPMLDVVAAFAPNEIQDGGRTPGPFDDKLRKLNTLPTNLPASPAGIRKRKRREKKRRWVWTIGQEEENEEELGGALAALRAEANRLKGSTGHLNSQTASIPRITYTETPTPSIESSDSGSEFYDVDMSDASSFTSEDRCLTPSDADLDMKTPTAPTRRSHSLEVSNSDRDTPIPQHLVPKRDTPIPPE
ncbi:hypothetical protein HJFPF1_06444 [Paramyrothecium foliicola]|nr:hypothetical protein HJFPF1_06444 [Paramyrothecium foliicola]